MTAGPSGKKEGRRAAGEAMEGRAGECRGTGGAETQTQTNTVNLKQTRWLNFILPYRVTLCLYVLFLNVKVFIFFQEVKFSYPKHLRGGSGKNAGP